MLRRNVAELNKLLITGCTGAIGSAIVDQAIKADYKVTCIVHKNSKRLSNLPKLDLVSIIKFDLCDYKNLELSEKYDVFIHLAWDKTFGGGRDDVDVQLKNVGYTLDAIRLAKRCGCSVFIGAGSQAEYGVQTVDLTPDLPVNPESGYGIAKYTAGKMSAMLCKQLGLRFNWLRILSVYGKNDGENSLISYTIRELKNGRSPEFTKCEQDWDYLNSEDAARAFLAVAEKGIDGKIYPLGYGKGRKLSEYLIDIQKIINPEIKLEFGKKEYYPHQPMHLVADVSELIKDTCWNPEVNFINGIKEIL